MISVLLQLMLAMTSMLHAPGLDGPIGSEPAKSWTGGVLSISAIGVDSVAVVAYPGDADDGPGTRIQDRGMLASPYGGNFGTLAGPGQLGNLVITGHRNTAGGPFRGLSELKPGAEITLTTDEASYTYKVRRSMWISYRSNRDLARQSAPVPGHPGRVPHRSYLTLTTCATQEDHAAGNYWHDELKNPEHRFVRVAVLVDVQAP
jgi:sortase A